ncbi:uncharacterized protein [Dermacentor andersoni]|uniref:uncharacterized protein n=1 Tax=Dermacentor andersoni TaxID=34620 RepID=UPI003B3BE3E4
MLQKSIEYTWLHPWLGTGLLTSTGAKWKTRRRMLTPAFHFRILEDFLPVMNEHSVVFKDLLKQHVGRPDGVDVVPSVARCTLDVICETAMGTCVNAQQCSDSKYVRAVLRLGELWFSRATKPWTWNDFTYRFTADSVEFDNCVNTVHTFTRKVIKDRKKMLLELQAASEQIDGAGEDEYLNLSGCRRAFLDLLLSQHFKDPSFTEEDIREEVDTFTFEGHDTTAVGISWTLYLLGLHQDVQQKVYEELEDIFGDDRDRDATMEDIRRMKYLECAIKEAQRLFPSVPLVGRLLQEDWTYDGYIIPKGTVCTVFIYVLHRDPREFPKPEEYIPERFLPENCVGRHPFAYVPFSAGYRNCIGQKFASMEMKTLVSRVLRNYKLESMYHRDKVQAVAELVLRARNGLRIRLIPRETEEAFPALDGVNSWDQNAADRERQPRGAMEPVPPLYKPLLHSRIVSACVSVAVIAVLFYCARMLTRTIRAYACLWNIPHPYERFPFCLLLDLWQRVASMDSSLEVPAKIFNYLDSVFYQIHDQDVTVAFYGPKPFLIAVTPDTVERVLSSTENVNKSFLYAMLKSWVGNGLLTSEKAIWKTRRKVLTPAFHFRILDEYVPIMNRRAALLCDKLAALGRDHFDVLPVMRIATFGILFETAMGIKLDEEDVKKTGFLKVNDEIATAIVTRMMNIHHWPEFIYKRTEVGRKFYEKVELIKKYTRDILSCRKKTYNIEGGEAVQKKSFMDILLRMHMEEGIFTEEEIREEVNTFMIGGFDTTATAASFAMHLLGNHPEAQSKVHEELDAVFGSDRERPVTREDIAQLKYLDCVIKETLRLYPPIPAIARKLGEDLILGKHTIPKGTVTIIFIYFMHRHPRFVPKPNDFTPERFLEFDKERHPFLYIPFAGGARNCIGQKFAQLEDKILLAQILRRFKVESKTRSEDLQMSLELVLRPTQGLHIKLTPRNHAVT